MNILMNLLRSDDDMAILFRFGEKKMGRNITGTSVN